jgi:uncharacterized YccA/Bax inhibitor family protein
MMRTANPVLNQRTFSRMGSFAGSDTMTIQGTVMKTGIMLFLTVISASMTWRMAVTGGNATPWVIGGGIGGFIMALATMFKPTWGSITAPGYALLKGLFLGAISAFFEMRYPGLVFNAVCLTFGTLFSLLFAYQTGFIKATENFKLGIFAATGAIFLLYMVNLVMGFFGSSIPFIHSSGTFGIIFSLVVVVIAALNLVLDFDFIENGAAAGAPKYMEWVGALGLMVTLVWLYIEILHLLSKLQSRR